MDTQGSRARLPPSTGYGRTILIIDDDVWIRSVIAEFLTEEGFSVEQAGDGQSGLWLAEQLQPDLILLDLALPLRSGLEVLEQLKERHPTCEIPVIIVSAYAMLAVPGGAERAHAVVQKPFDLKDLLDRINQVVKDAQIPATAADLRRALL